MMERQASYWNEKFYVEPDLGDQRQSAFKALPSPPATPRRIMHRFRLSALLAFALGVIGFVLTLVITLAGRNPGDLEDYYMLKLNASHVGQDIIRFEEASSTSSATPSATASGSSDPLDVLNPASTASPLNPNNPNNPLNQLTGSLEPILGNLTDSINNGLEDAINQIAEALVDSAGLKDFYYLYVNSVCEGNLANGTGGNDDGVVVDKCSSYGDKSAGLNNLLPNIQSSVVIGTTNISIPLIAELTHSIGTLSSGITTIGRALLAFLIISMIGSGVSMLVALPSIFFPAARILIYTNLFFSTLAAFGSFLAAILLTALIAGVSSAIGGIGDALGLSIEKGSAVLALAWVSWACIFAMNMYWSAIWFVEVRRWAFMKRRRTSDEVGNWKGVGSEVWRDLKGEKSL